MRKQRLLATLFCRRNDSETLIMNLFFLLVFFFTTLLLGPRVFRSRLGSDLETSASVMVYMSGSELEGNLEGYQDYLKE